MITHYRNSKSTISVTACVNITAHTVTKHVVAMYAVLVKNILLQRILIQKYLLDLTVFAQIGVQLMTCVWKSVLRWKSQMLIQTTLHMSCPL